MITEQYKPFYQLNYQDKECLFSGQSSFQKVEIFETEFFGKMLINDGFVMLTEKDEFVYHEMIAHVPLLVHPHPQNVLIIGGGDGGTAREVMQHPSVQKCTLVEIDKMVVESCKEFIPLCAQGLVHPNVQVLIQDGLKFVAESSEKFDVVLVDSTDPIGPAAPLFGEKFYQDIANILADNGIVVSQAENPWFEQPMQGKLQTILNGIFSEVHFYNYHNLTYPGGTWSLSFASKNLHPLKDRQSRDVPQNLKYYNQDIHQAAFALPNFMQK